MSLINSIEKRNIPLQHDFLTVPLPQFFPVIEFIDLKLTTSTIKGFQPKAPKTPKIKFNLADIKEQKEFVPHFYKIQESERLNNRLINKYHKDVLATVGTYNPYPPTWESTDKKSDNWGKKSDRFIEKKVEAKLGPGSYQNTDLYTPKPVASSFKSTTKRFKPPASNQISPASYNVTFTDIAGTCSFCRMLDPPRTKKISGTESQILSELSATVVCKPAFIETKNRMNQDVTIVDVVSSRLDVRASRQDLKLSVSRPSSIAPSRVSSPKKTETTVPVEELQPTSPIEIVIAPDIVVDG
ncbi:hypothetical protein HDV06_001332 [Boothiomyces sp. JEL0866]|nr:hypothetical protein HDV06_001332 [Boothiomyces sp. JEL0866]